MSVHSSTTLPRHLAVIMDGNGRWARARNLPRVAGHRKGAESVRKTVTAARERGIECLSLFAFSSQNWSRPSPEVSALMTLLLNYVKSERSTILDNGIRLTAIGDLEKLPRGPHDALLDLIEVSKNNDKMTLCLAISYGGREEIVSAARSIARSVSSGEISAEDVDLDVFERHTWSHEIGPVDLMIRTSGELRISNFLLFGLAYSELYFTEKMWPDFDEEELDRALADYASRQRRFGKVL